MTGSENPLGGSNPTARPLSTLEISMTLWIDAKLFIDGERVEAVGGARTTTSIPSMNG